jgi:protein TonB
MGLCCRRSVGAAQLRSWKACRRAPTLSESRSTVFEDFLPTSGARRSRRPRAGLLALSVGLHLGAVAVLLGVAAQIRSGRGEQPIEVLLLHAANAGGAGDAAEAPLSPAARRAELERQAMLDRLVQPSTVPDSVTGTGSPAAPGGRGDGETDLPVAAGGGVVRPEVIESSRVMPVYPEEAQQAGLEGLVVLKVVIDERGRVGEIEVLRGVGHGLDEAAVAAVRQWRFRPATRDGKPIKVVHVIPFDFRL